MVTRTDEDSKRVGNCGDEGSLPLQKERKYRTRASGLMRRIWKSLGWPFLTDIVADKMWEATGWPWEDPSVQAFTTLHNFLEKHTMVEEQKCAGDESVPHKFDTMGALVGTSQQGHSVEYGGVKVGRTECWNGTKKEGGGTERTGRIQHISAG